MQRNPRLGHPPDPAAAFEAQVKLAAAAQLAGHVPGDENTAELFGQVVVLSDQACDLLGRYVAPEIECRSARRRMSPPNPADRSALDPLSTERTMA
jgi:hypothetical protein